MEMRIEGGHFPIQPEKRVEPIEPSSQINNDRKPRSQKLPKSPRKPIAEPEPDEDELTNRDTAEISEAAWQALDAYNESRDTESER